MINFVQYTSQRIRYSYPVNYDVLSSGQLDDDYRLYARITNRVCVQSKGGILAKAYEYILDLQQKCGLTEQHYNKEDVEELLNERNQLKNEVCTYMLFCLIIAYGIRSTNFV